MDSVGGTLRISREHLCCTPGGGKKHRLAVDVMQSAHQSTGHRSFSSSGIAIEQKHRVAWRSEAKACKSCNEGGLRLIWGVVEKTHHQFSEFHQMAIIVLHRSRQIYGASKKLLPTHMVSSGKITTIGRRYKMKAEIFQIIVFSGNPSCSLFCHYSVKTFPILFL